MRPASAIVIGCLGVAGVARAGTGSLHATASGDVAATDNAFGAPSGSAQGDMLFDLRPGVLYAYEGQRVTSDLDATVELLEYAVNSDQPSFLFHGGWQGLFLPGPRSAVTLSASGGTGKVNAMAARTSPDQTTIGLLPTGALSTQDANGSEEASWEANRSTQLLQAAFARWTGTDDNAAMATTTSSLEVGATIGFNWSRDGNALSLMGGVSYERLGRIAPTGAIPPSTLLRQLNPNATLTWTHDINKVWSFALDGGAVYLHSIAKDPYNPMAVQKDTLFPTAGGLLAYTEAWGRATLSVRRSVSPNPLLAENTVDNALLAQVALPLPWLDSTRRSPKLEALGTLGVDRTELLDPTSNKSISTFDIAHVDVGVMWTPEAGRTFGVRYQLLAQHGDSTSATMAAPSFISNTLFLTFALMMPGRVNAHVPKLLGSVRADRSDIAPVGAEPVVPEPALPGDGGGDE